MPQEIKAQVTKIQTTADLAIRITLEIDKDLCPSDIFTIQGEMVKITVE